MLMKKAKASARVILPEPSTEGKTGDPTLRCVSFCSFIRPLTEHASPWRAVPRKGPGDSLENSTSYQLVLRVPVSVERTGCSTS